MGSANMWLEDSKGNKTGYKDGNTYEEIPNTQLFNAV
jgi:hypothetical protein